MDAENANRIVGTLYETTEYSALDVSPPTTHRKEDLCNHLDNPTVDPINPNADRQNEPAQSSG